jgi:hypothetical protein
MPGGSFVVTLDTHAPSVTFGDPTGAMAGELLHLPYTTDEPLDRAELCLADGRHLQMDVGVDELTVLLPPDTWAAPAAVWVRDAVWNARTYTAAVVLQGIAPPPPPPEPPSVPGVPGVRARSRSQRRIVSTSRVHAGARTRVRARGAYVASSLTTSRTRISAARAATSVVEVRSSGQITARMTSRSDPHPVGARDSVHRGDGPSAEAAILDLL